MILAADRLVHARSLGVAKAQADVVRAQLAYDELKAEADRRATARLRPLAAPAPRPTSPFR
jgi:hypothetical protein